MELQSVLKHRRVLVGFWREWFSAYLGREVFQDKGRVFLTSNSQFLDYIEDCKLKHAPCYVSVQPFRERDKVSQIEKLFFDFDSPKIMTAWHDAKTFCDNLCQSYKVEPLLVYSGRKGYHCYVFLKNIVYFEDNNDAKIFYETAQRMLLSGLKFETLDMQVVGDIKRLARVPYTTHEKTGNPAVPLTLNHTPCLILTLQPYREHGLPDSFTQLCLQKVEKKMQKTLRLTRRFKPANVRPCIKEALETPLDGKHGHLMRLAIAIEYLNQGYAVEDVVKLFQGQDDFNEEKTAYFVKDAKNRAYKPFKCRTIRTLGFCLGDSCRIHKRGEENEG